MKASTKKARSWLIRLFFFLIAILITGMLVLVETSFFLAFGWIYYLYRIVPNVKVNTLVVLEGLGAAVILTAMVHYFMSWFYQNYGNHHEEERAGRRWNFRWTLTGVAVFILMFVTSISTTGFIHQTGWLLQGPIVNTGMEYSSRAAGTQMKIIGEALSVYYKENKHFPITADYVNLQDAGIPISYYKGPYKDVGGTPYQYNSDGRTYVLRSLGRNRVLGGGEGSFDDLVYSDGHFIVSPSRNN